MTFTEDVINFFDLGGMAKVLRAVSANMSSPKCCVLLCKLLCWLCQDRFDST